MRTTTYQALAALVAGATAAVHLLIAATVDLSVDEAHYGLYARFLDWSYFDHPPMTGWLLWTLTPLGLNELTLRLPSALIYLLCSYLIYHISAATMAGGSAARGLLAVAIFSVTPMVQLLGFGLVPEFPLLLWALLIAMVVNRLQSDSALAAWILFGLLFGLAALTKYTAILLVCGVALHWLLQGQLLQQCKRPALYLAIAISVMVASPVFIWNYLHDWASFRYQLNHTAGGEWQLTEALKALAVLLLSYSLLLVVGGIIALKDIPRADIRGILACLALPILLFVFASSGNGWSLPHWSLLGWALLTPAVSHWLIDNWQRRPVRWLAWFGNGLALLLSTVLLLILAFKPLGLLPWAAPALRDLSGWKQAAHIASKLEQQYTGGAGVILVSNWSQASRIAWYAWPHPVQVLDDRPGQFAYWYGLPDRHTRGVLVRDNIDEDEIATSRYSKMSLQCDLIQRYDDAKGGVVINRFYFYRCAAPH